MASSRKPRNASVAVALSGGVDSTVLLHRLSREKNFSLAAIHVHHGLSPNADSWARFCRSFCKRLGVPLLVRKVSVRKAGKGLESAARDARYEVFLKSKFDVIALAHNLDDQAETVLMNLLRGAGARGASGMPERSRRGGKTFWRPLLSWSRREILGYAREHGLDWIEDESNADEALTRNFIRRRVGPLLESRFPRWQQALARAAKHIAKKEAGREELLREFLRSKGLRAPSEARLAEMLRQLASGGKKVAMRHDGAELRLYRGKVSIETPGDARFAPLEWKGERTLKIPALGGELRFVRSRGKGIALDSSRGYLFSIRLRAGGERLQPDSKRPRRTLKNLFQEAGVPPWERERLPLLFCGDDLVWVPGVGVDARYQAAAGAEGVLPEWRR
ncbi:MAG TPA: tRNA lysidine(34) synthetase TilS [Burkholderiales bacterium]